jgi:hypothetical protein
VSKYNKLLTNLLIIPDFIGEKSVDLVMKLYKFRPRLEKLNKVKSLEIRHVKIKIKPITIGASGSQDGAGTCATGDSADAWYNGTTGKYNGSLYFDGTDDYISVSNSKLSLNGTGESVFLWIKHNGSTSIVHEGNWTRRLFGTSSTLIDKNSAYHYLNTTGSNDNNWHLVGYTLNNGMIRSYVDGKEIDSEATADLNASSSTWWFGRVCSGADCNQYYAGQLDDIRIYGYPLTETQIKQLFNEGAAVRFGPSSGSP